jgi:hypothetical protein
MLGHMPELPATGSDKMVAKAGDLDQNLPKPRR